MTQIHSHKYKDALKSTATCPNMYRSCPVGGDAVPAPLHKRFQEGAKHSYELIHKSKNIIKQGNEQSAKGSQDNGASLKPVNQFKT